MVIRTFIIRILAKYSGKGFDEAEDDLDGFKRGARGASKGLTELQKETRKAKAEAKALAKQEREAAKALKAAARETDKAVKANQRLAKTNAKRIASQIAKREKKVAAALKVQAKAAEKTARANKRLRESQERASLVALGLARAEGQAAAATNRAGDEARKASSSWSTVGAEFAGVAGAAGGIGLALGAVIAPVLLVGAKFQSLRAQLDNLVGSSEKGKEAFDFIQEFAVTTPFMLDEVTAAFIALEGRGIEPTSRRMKALGDIASANNKTFDDVVQAALDASGGEGERLRELGIIMKKSGDQVSLSFRGQTIEAKNNKMAITDALVTLGEMKGVAGSMAAQMDTLAGQFSNAKGSVIKFLNAAAQTGGLERAGEILAMIGDKLINPTNARLFGEAIDEILTTIRDGLKDVEPGTITDGFRALLNVIKLLAIALKPFLALWRAGLGLLERIEGVTNSVLELAKAFEGLVTGQISVKEAALETAKAFGIIDDEARTATIGMDNLKKSALDAVNAVKKAVTGAFVEDATTDELKAIAANEKADAATRAAARTELSTRAEKAKKAKATVRRSSAVSQIVKDASNDELTDIAADKSQGKDLQARAKAELKARKRSKRDQAAGKKARSGQFFNFEDEAKAVARTRGEEFAAEELERLVSSGVGFGDAQKQARIAGKARAEELEIAFKKAGKISKKGGSKNILDILGLKGPGSVLKGREAPASLIIAPVFTIKLIETFNQTIESVAGSKALEEVTGQAGQAAVNAGFGDLKATVDQWVDAALTLQVDRLLKMDGGGQLPAGPEG